MRLLVENIARIERADITINGISVLAGYNATGKSTISKSLYGIILAYTNILSRAADSQRRSIDQCIDDFLADLSESDFFEPQSNDELINSLLQEDLRLPESYSQFLLAFAPYASHYDKLPEASADTEYLYGKFRAQIQKAISRPQSDYVRFLVEGSVRRSFDNQINTLGQDTTGTIALQSDSGAPVCYALFRDNKVLSCSTDAIKEAAPIYLEPKHALDSLETGFDRNRIRIRPPVLNYLRQHSRNERTLERTLEDREKEERIVALIDDAIQGGLVEEKGSLQYIDERIRMPVSLKNIASGSKTFAVLKRLTENGQFRKNHTLIIDEPEVNLHPAWQLILAEVLVILHEELNLKIFLNTHSPYFVRAVDTYSKRHRIENRCHFYKTAEQKSGLYQVEDVTNQMEKIYRDLYLPFEEI